jgi:uncharacterized MnhB-related membrane protein
MKFFNNLGKREALVYIIIILWVIMGGLTLYKSADLIDLSIYFGSLTAYAATYIWSETRRPSEKTGILKPGVHSRRELMIYVIVVLWAIGGIAAIFTKSNLESLATYFISLTGFVGAWIAGERYKPEDHVIKKKTEYPIQEEQIYTGSEWEDDQNNENKAW